MKKYSVGLDLSYTGTGVVILGDEEVKPYEFKAGKAHLPSHERIVDLWKQLKRVLPSPEDNDVNILIEGAAYGAEFGAFMLGELNGGIKTLLFINGFKYEVAAPTTVKKYATGSGNAQKTFVAGSVAQKWNFVHASNNVTDAYVMAKIAEKGLLIVEEEFKAMKKKPKAKRAKTKKEELLWTVLMVVMKTMPTM